MGDVSEPDVEEERPSRFTRILRALGLARASPDAPPLPLVSKILLALGALSVYNVATNYQTLLDLSESIHWLARWWRYLIGIPFEWLKIDITEFQRETIVLLTFFTGSAGVAIYRWKRVSPHKHFIKAIMEVGSSSYEITPESRPFAVPETTSGKINLHLSTALIAVTLIALVHGSLGPTTIRFVVGFGIYVFVIGALLLVRVYLARKGSKSLGVIAATIGRVLLFPVGVVLIWSLVLVGFRREILRSLVALLIVLALDIALKYSLDPLLHTFPTLPEPPTHNSAHR